MIRRSFIEPLDFAFPDFFFNLEIRLFEFYFEQKSPFKSIVKISGKVRRRNYDTLLVFDAVKKNRLNVILVNFGSLCRTGNSVSEESVGLVKKKNRNFLPAKACLFTKMRILFKKKRNIAFRTAVPTAYRRADVNMKNRPPCFFRNLKDRLSLSGAALPVKHYAHSFRK